MRIPFRRWRARTIFVAAMTMAGPCGALAAPALSGPSEYVKDSIAGATFNIPLAEGRDKTLIQKASQNRSGKLNLPFYSAYHAPMAAAVRKFSAARSLGPGDQVNLFGWLVIRTHNENKIGYLWGGDLEDGPGGGTSGIGYDCSGFVWTVWETIAPESVFANGGVRIASHDYLKLGRKVIGLAKVDSGFIETLRRKGRPGDVIIDPNGHIALYGYDPRTEAREPVVMENGEYWNNLDRWLLRNKGNRMEVRSCFDENGRLLPGKGGRSSRALPSLSAQPQLIASSGGAARPRFDASSLPPPAPFQAQQFEDELGSAIRAMKAFGAESQADPNRPNTPPRITAVKAEGARLPNDSLKFVVEADDEDADPIVQFRVRRYGSEEWLLCDRPYFQTSAPGYAGELYLEFQAVDARGALSAATVRRIEVFAN